MNRKLIIATKHALNKYSQVNDFWQEESHALTGLDITSIDIQGQNGLVGTTEDVYVTENAGQDWILDSRGIETPHVRWVSLHPDDPRYHFVGTEPANIYTRRIGEQTWRQADEIPRLRDKNQWYMPYSPNPGCVRGFAFHGDRVYAAVEVGGLLVSEDYGDTWQFVPGSTGKPRQNPKAGEIHPDVHSVETHTASPDLIYAPTGGGFYMSEDGGKEWALKYDCYCRAVWVDPVNAAHIILGPADGVSRGGRIEMSRDGGDTWQPIMDNLVDLWPEAMVERFFSVDQEIFAILSNGKVLTAKKDELSWQYLLPGIGNVVMLTVI